MRAAAVSLYFEILAYWPYFSESIFPSSTWSQNPWCLRILFILSLDRSISAFIANKDRCLIFFACTSSSCIRAFSKSSLVASRAMVKIFACVSAFMRTGGLLTRNSSYSSSCLFVPPIYSYWRKILSPSAALNLRLLSWRLCGHLQRSYVPYFSAYGRYVESCDALGGASSLYAGAW